ncbi:MAG: hypothetical protein INR62_03380 [Rhodospirillales bacterium]|nr:hypothetical protein [Acetobacter sp.]
MADYQLPRRRRARPRYFDELERAPATAGTRGGSNPSSVQFAVILLLAAALGCAVGYWAYLQLPSPVIALSVKAMPSSMLVTWPSEQTREAVYAAIRVDDGPPVLLSAEDRNSGTTTVAGSPDSVKVELIIRHWLRDSRGIVRYLRGTAAPLRPGQTGVMNGAALRSRNHVAPQSVPQR